MAAKKKSHKLTPSVPRLGANDHTSGKLTPEVLVAICESHASGLLVKDSCHNAGVSMTAFSEFRRKHPDFETTDWAEARTKFIFCIEDKLFENALGNNMTAIIFSLKAHFPEKYRDNVNMTHNASEGFASTFAAAMSVLTNGPSGVPIQNSGSKASGAFPEVH